MLRQDSSLGDSRHRIGCPKSLHLAHGGAAVGASRRLICRDRGDGATVLAMQRCLCGSILPHPQQATQVACWAATPLREGFTSEADHDCGLRTGGELKNQDLEARIGVGVNDPNLRAELEI